MQGRKPTHWRFGRMPNCLFVVRALARCFWAAPCFRAAEGMLFTVDVVLNSRENLRQAGIAFFASPYSCDVLCATPRWRSDGLGGLLEVRVFMARTYLPAGEIIS